jgi:Flp pilus assembly protein TadD
MLGALALKNGDLDTAIKELRIAVRLNAESGEAHRDFAIALLRNGIAEQAVTELTRATKLLPDDSSAWWNLGTALKKISKQEESSRAFAVAHDLNDKVKNRILARTYHNEGTKSLRDGNIAEAQEKLQRAISLDPSDGLAHYNYGVALLLVNRLSEALKEFERAIDLNAGEPNAYYYLGRVLIAQDKPADAVRHLQRASDLMPLDASRAQLIGRGTRCHRSVRTRTQGVREGDEP